MKEELLSENVETLFQADDGEVYLLQGEQQEKQLRALQGNGNIKEKGVNAFLTNQDGELCIWDNSLPVAQAVIERGD